MGDYADDREMKLNSVHPEQHEETERPPEPEGTEIRMPGGLKGFKPKR